MMCLGFGVCGLGFGHLEDWSFAAWTLSGAL